MAPQHILEKRKRWDQWFNPRAGRIVYREGIQGRKQHVPLGVRFQVE